MALTQADIVEGLVARGLPRHIAEGFALNFQDESGLNPSINESNPLIEGSRGGGYLAQWTGPRRRAYEAYAAERGVAPSDVGAQLDFTIHELRTTEGAALTALQGTTTAGEAASVLVNKFFRPSEEHRAARSARYLNQTNDSVAGRAVGRNVPPENVPQDWGPVHQAFLSGQMTPEQQVIYQDALKSGEIPAMQVPQTILDAYNGGQMTPEQKAQVNAAAQAGIWTMPEVPQEARGVLGEIGHSVGVTARAAASGLASLPNMVVDPLVQGANMVLPDNMQQMTGTELVSGVSDAIGLPVPENDAEMLSSSIVSGMVGGGAAAKAAKLLAGFSTGTTAAVGEQLAAAPLSQIVGGGTAAASGEATRQAGGGTAAQIAASLIGGGVGAGLTPKRLDVPAAPQAPPTLNRQAALDAARGADIPVMTSDLFPPNKNYSLNFQSYGEKIPYVGTGPVRARQETARIAAIRNTLEDFGATFDESGATDNLEEMVGALTEERQAALDNYSTMKNEVFANVANAGPVPIPATMARIDAEIARLRGLNNAHNDPIIAELENQRNAFSNQNITNVDKNRNLLGRVFDSNTPAATRDEGNIVLKGLYNSVREDIGDFVQANGTRKDYTRWRVANARLSEMAGELSNTALRNVLKNGEATPETISRMLFSTDRSNVRRLYRALPPSGRANARAAILNRALSKAQTSNGIETSVSPQQFANEVDRLGKQVGIFFNGSQLRQVEGLSRALALTRRATQAAANPATGQSLSIPVGAGVLTSMFGGVGGGLAAGGGIASAARFYESAPVRNLLMALGSTRSGSAVETKIMQSLYRAAMVEQQMQQVNQATQEQDNGRQ